MRSPGCTHLYKRAHSVCTHVTRDQATSAIASQEHATPTTRAANPWINDLVFAFKLALHAFDSSHLAVLDTLRFEDLREGSLAFLCYQSILCHVAV